MPYSAYNYNVGCKAPTDMWFPSGSFCPKKVCQHGNWSDVDCSCHCAGENLQLQPGERRGRVEVAAVVGGCRWRCITVLGCYEEGCESMNTGPCMHCFSSHSSLPLTPPTPFLSRRLLHRR